MTKQTKVQAAMQLLASNPIFQSNPECLGSFVKALAQPGLQQVATPMSLPASGPPTEKPQGEDGAIKARKEFWSKYKRPAEAMSPTVPEPPSMLSLPTLELDGTVKGAEPASSTTDLPEPSLTPVLAKQVSLTGATTQEKDHDAKVNAYRTRLMKMDSMELLRAVEKAKVHPEFAGFAKGEEIKPSKFGSVDAVEELVCFQDFLLYGEALGVSPLEMPEPSPLEMGDEQMDAELSQTFDTLHLDDPEPSQPVPDTVASAAAPVQSAGSQPETTGVDPPQPDTVTPAAAAPVQPAQVEPPQPDTVTPAAAAPVQPAQVEPPQPDTVTPAAAAPVEPPQVDPPQPDAVTPAAAAAAAVQPPQVDPLQPETSTPAAAAAAVQPPQVDPPIVETPAAMAAGPVTPAVAAAVQPPQVDPPQPHTPAAVAEPVMPAAAVGVDPPEPETTAAVAAAPAMRGESSVAEALKRMQTVDLENGGRPLPPQSLSSTGAPEVPIRTMVMMEVGGVKVPMGLPLTPEQCLKAGLELVNPVATAEVVQGSPSQPAGSAGPTDPPPVPAQPAGSAGPMDPPPVPTQPAGSAAPMNPPPVPTQPAGSAAPADPPPAPSQTTADEDYCFLPNISKPLNLWLFRTSLNRSKCGKTCTCASCVAKRDSYLHWWLHRCVYIYIVPNYQPLTQDLTCPRKLRRSLRRWRKWKRNMATQPKPRVFF